MNRTTTNSKNAHCKVCATQKEWARCKSRAFFVYWLNARRIWASTPQIADWESGVETPPTRLTPTQIQKGKRRGWKPLPQIQKGRTLESLRGKEGTGAVRLLKQNGDVSVPALLVKVSSNKLYP